LLTLFFTQAFVKIVLSSNFMSKTNNFITAIDIGSHSIKAINVLKKPGVTDTYEIFGKAEIPSFGVRKGIVQDPDKLAEKIKLLLEELDRLSGQKIVEAYASINGSHIFTKESHGSIAISRADEKISQEDVDRVVESAQAISLPHNKEVLITLPNEFIVEGDSVKDPVGMKGVRLETDVMAVCLFSPYQKALEKSLLDADLQVCGVSASPLAASRAVLDLQQKELGVVIIDIGAATTGMAVFQEGKLMHMAIFPIGSDNITNDIAIGLQTSIENAENIKKKIGLKIVSKPKAVKVKGKTAPNQKTEEDFNFDPKILNKIIASRVIEIFGVVNKELKMINKAGKLPGGAVITGGGAKIDGILEYAKKELKLPVSLGYPKSFLGLEKDPLWSVACGIALLAFDEGIEEQGSENGFVLQMKKIFKIFKP